ncbi:MAG: DUF1214 domain-containing protein [Stellaceae bacterium]
MTSEVYGYLRRFCLASALTAGLAMTVGVSAGVAQAPVGPDAIAGDSQAVSQLSPFNTTVAYVAQFYPLWFTYYQTRLTQGNRLVGPNRISPLYHYVVAINVDTLYASTYLDLTDGPVIVTIPTTPPFPSQSYSILSLDPYGDVLPASIPKAPGSYALIGPGGFTGTLPKGVTSILLPVNFSALIFRADKFSPNNENQIKQADAFRRLLKAQTLTDYLKNPRGGATKIVPEIVFSVPFKTTADNLIARDPIAFLRQLQRAVASDHTPTLSPYEEALSNRFDSLFANRNANRSEFSAGAQAAHELILDSYFTHTDWTPTPTNWIHFTNIGAWGNQVVERSSITEFIQYANNRTAAAYYHVFKDANGNPLNGSSPRGYFLTFPPGQQPEATRFWSLTAYTPEAIELVPNPVHKYAVARYTPGLQANKDGSVSVYMARQLPAGVPMANWLPIPRGAFNIMLRVYGPKGTVEANTYVPPPIEKR